MKRALLMAIVALASACGSDFDPSSRIQSFRVIAVKAGKLKTTGCPPGQSSCVVPNGSWAQPGDTISLEALYDDPKGNGRVTTWAWLTCVKPSSSTVLGCFQQFVKDHPGDLASFLKNPPEGSPCAKSKSCSAFTLGPNQNTFTVPIDADILDGVPAEAAAGAIVGVITLACPGEIQPKQPANKNDLPVQCVDNGKVLGADEFVAGIKRIFLRKKDTNADPIIRGVTLDGQPWNETSDMDAPVITASCGADENRFDRCDDSGKKEISVDIDPSSFETGTDEFGNAFNEQVVVQYYATEGLFEYDVKRGQEPKTRFAGRSGKTGVKTVWIVVRDNRGGVSWVERKIRIQ